MDLFLREYGKMLIEVVVTVSMFTLLASGVFISKNGNSYNGILRFAGQEATIKQNTDTAANPNNIAEPREGISSTNIANVSISISFKGDIPLNTKTKIRDVFIVTPDTYNGKKLPIVITKITNQNNIDVLNSTSVKVENEYITFFEPGEYIVYAGTPINKQKFAFKILVNNTVN